MRVYLNCRITILSLAVFVGLCLPSRVRADIGDNPYIELYRLRVAQAELNLSRKIALDELAASKLERGKRLVAAKAISPQDFDVLVSEAAVTKSDRILADKKIEEAKTYQRIIEALVTKGVSIPLCTYEME